MPQESVVERFWKKVDKKSDSECWNWLAAKDRRGYGRFSIDYKMVLAHRFSLEVSLGEKIEDGLFALHSCDNPSCVNPAHLREGTAADNMDDAIERGRQKAKKGSENPNAKITEQDVVEIRRLYATSEMPGTKLAEKYGISQANVYEIIHRTAWKHVA